MKGSRTKYSSGFDPKTIPGCSLWLDAADRTTLSFSGSNVTQWRDKSGTGNHYATGGAITHSNNALVFPGNATLSNTNPINFSAGTTPSMSTFVVVSTPDGSQERGIFQYGQISCGQTGYAVYVYTPSEIHCTLYCGALSVRNAITTNTRMLVSDVVSYSGTPGSLSRAGWFNGAPMSVTNATTTGVNLNLNSSSVIGNVAGGFWNGTMNEILYFNRALSTVERQQVEGYLSRKWALTQVNLLSAPHPYQTLPPAGVLPTTIPGCALWLDAADASTLTLSGSNVTAWADKSGNGRTATAQSAASYSAANNALSFTSGNYYSFSNLSFAVNSYFSFFIVERLQSSSSLPHLLGTDATGDNQSLHVRYNGTGNGSGNASAFRFAFYNNDLDAQNIPAFTTAAAQPIRVWSLVFTTSFRGIYLNGTLMTSDANNTKLSSWNTPLIGRSYGGYYYTGLIYELLGFGGQLSTAQRQQVEGYLAWKWGTLTTSIAVPATHPYATFPPTLRPFGPTDVSGCILWLDAADRKTLFQDSGGTQPITAVGQSIGLWRDKSSRGYLMTVPSGKSAPTYGQNVINTTGTNALWSTTNFELTGNAKLTLFFVFACSVASGYNTSCAAWIGNPNGPVGGKIIGLGIAVQGLPSSYEYYVPSTFETATAPFISQPRLVGVTTLTMAKYDGASVFGNYNGTPLAPSGLATSGGANWSALPFQTGLRSANAGGSADGFMCEVLCYNDALSTLQIQQIEGYLARKWGLNSSVAVGHPYRFGLPPLTAEVTPRALTGCALWLDAADRSTLTLTGSNITQWADKSGNSNTAVAGTSTYPIYAQNGLNGAPIVRLQGANDYFLVANNFTMTTYPSLTYFIVINPAASQPHGSHSGILSTDTPGAFGRTLALGAGSWQQEYYTGFTNITPYTANVWTLVSLGFVGTSSATLHLNGVAYAATASGTGTNTTGFKIGSYNDTAGYATYNATFDCAEILVYGASLTTVERQQIEGYLAWKWGLQGSLPGGHPFRMLKP
jgi:hypothetical protein